VQFAANIGVDLSPSAANGNLPLSNPPVRSGNYEILFAPSGAVVGQGTGSGLICFWVRDLTANIATDVFQGFPIIICVQPRTGFISSHQPAQGADLFLFARDGKSSGM
jgi:hypothetical protein